MGNLAKYLNVERVFDVDTSSFDFINLKSLYERDGDGMVYTIRGAYISTKSEYAEESPLLAIDDMYVNIPQHQLPVVKMMLADKKFIKAINSGELGFVIEQYNKKLKSGQIKVCYKAIIVDIDAGAMIDE